MEPKNENNQNLIERYFDGELSGQDKQDFKEQLKDPEFRSEFFFHKAMAEAIHKDHQDAHLKQLFEAEEKKIAGKSKIFRLVWAAAAAVAVLIIAGYFIYPQLSDSSNDAVLFAEVYDLRKDPNTNSGVKGTDNPNPEENPNQDCIDQYIMEEYSVAIECLQKILATNPDAIEINNILGHCYFAEKNYKAAIQQFDKVLASPIEDAEFRQEVEWNRILNLRMLNDGSHQAELDKFLENTTSFYQKKAEELKALDTK